MIGCIVAKRTFRRKLCIWYIIYLRETSLAHINLDCSSQMNAYALNYDVKCILNECMAYN